TMDGFDRGSLFRFVLDSTNYDRNNIGRISLKNAYSFVEVSTSLAEEFIDTMRNQQYRGRHVRAEMAGEDPAGGERERGPREGSRSGGFSGGGKRSWGDRK